MNTTNMQPPRPTTESPQGPHTPYLVYENGSGTSMGFSHSKLVFGKEVISLVGGGYFGKEALSINCSYVMADITDLE